MGKIGALKAIGTGMLGFANMRFEREARAEEAARQVALENLRHSHNLEAQQAQQGFLTTQQENAQTFTTTEREATQTHQIGQEPSGLVTSSGGTVTKAMAEGLTSKEIAEKGWLSQVEYDRKEGIETAKQTTLAAVEVKSEAEAKALTLKAGRIYDRMIKENPGIAKYMTREEFTNSYSWGVVKSEGAQVLSPEEKIKIVNKNVDRLEEYKTGDAWQEDVVRYGSESQAEKEVLDRWFDEAAARVITDTTTGGKVKDIADREATSANIAKAEKLLGIATTQGDQAVADLLGINIKEVPRVLKEAQEVINQKVGETGVLAATGVKRRVLDPRASTAPDPMRFVNTGKSL
jgi:hypothetical protein